MDIIKLCAWGYAGLLGFVILLSLNRTSVLLGVASLVLVFTYPLMKRVTWWPQFFLGLDETMGDLVELTRDELREDYTVIASRLLPLLEANPENWEALSYLNLTPHRDNKPLAEHLADWQAVCPDRLKSFIQDLERLFLPLVVEVDDVV